MRKLKINVRLMILGVKFLFTVSTPKMMAINRQIGELQYVRDHGDDS